LLLGKAKDNNASCASARSSACSTSHFTLDPVRQAVVELQINGPEGFRLEGRSTMRDSQPGSSTSSPQTVNGNHQYRTASCCFGTLFAPVEDRDEPGRGFTHKVGDVVRVSATNWVHSSTPW